MAQWRIALRAEDVAALSRGQEIAVIAIDEESEVSEDSTDTGNVKMPRGKCAVVAFLAVALSACAGGSGLQVMKLRNDTGSTVQVARCQANQCAPSRDLAAQATLTVQMQRLAQGSAPDYLSIQTGAGDSRCILIPPATSATVGKTFYITVSDVTATDCG